MYRLLAILLLFSLIQCSIDRTMTGLSESDHRKLQEFQELATGNKSFISGKNEPGEPLSLCLTFVNKVDKIPLSNQLVKFYHTSASGDYQLTDLNDESSARLNGSASTDNQGRIYIETILPGDYGSSSDNRHIHTTVLGAKPEAYDIHFKQYTTYMGTRFSNGSDQHFLADLKMKADSTLVGFLTIEVKQPHNAN